MLELLAMVCLGLAWSIPNHYFPWTSFYNETASGLALLLLLISLSKRFAVTPLPTMVWIVSAVALIPLMQWATGLLAFSGDVWVSSLYLLTLATAIAVGHVWARVDTAAASTTLAATILIGGLGASAVAILQGLDMAQLGIWAVGAHPSGRPGANLAQPNNLATLLGMSSVSLLLIYERRRVSMGLGAVLVLVLFTAIAMSQSRTSLLFGPIVLAGVAIARRRGVLLRISNLAVAAAVAVYWMMAWAWPHAQTLLLLGGGDSIGSRGVESPRLTMWALLIDAVSQQAWLGYGWLQVGAAQLEAANRHPMTEELWLQGHNLILDLVVWCGVPLGVLLASLVLYWYVSRACRVRTLESVAGMLVVSIVGVHAMLELPHHYLYFLIPVGFWIGQIESSLTESRVQSRQVWNWIPVALSIGIAAMILRDYGKLEDDFRLVRFESLRIGSIRASQPAPDAPALSSLTAFLRFSRSTPHAGMNAVELADAEAITKRYPYGPSLAKCATALALNNRLAEAKQMFLSIRQIHGERIYRRLRGDLREQIETGQKELVPLDRALPG